MTLPYEYQLSARRCPRNHGWLVEDIGQAETTGELSVLRWCRDCDFREVQQAWSRAEIRRRIKRVNALHRIVDEGVVIPMRTDIPEVLPVEEWLKNA